MKRRNARNKAKEAEGPSKIVVGAKYVLALLALATLCICAAAQEETADEWYKKGRDLVRNGSYEEAVKAYDRTIELEPSNATFYISKVPSLNLLAILTNNQSKFNESLQAIDKALEIDPKNPRAWELKGNALSQMKRYNESLEAYERGIQNIGNYKGEISQTEESSGLWLDKAMALWQVGRTEESLGAFNESLQIDPANHDAWMMKGRTLAYLGLINESLKAFDEAASLEIFGPRPEVRASSWITKGNALMLTGRYLDALKVYDNVTGLNFTGTVFGFYLVDAWRGRSNALAGLGRYNESLQAFDKAIELNSEKAPYAWTGKGDALLASGRYDEAIIAYDRALKLYPEFADAGIAHAQKGKGDSLTKLGKHEEALAAYGEAVGASDKAITAFNNATPLDKAISVTFDPYPLDKEFWIDRGSALKALGREDEAKDAYENATRLNPNYAEAWFDKGLVLLALNRDVEADAAFAIAGYSAEPQFLLAPPVVTNVTSLGNDEFIELANNENVAQGFRNLRLIADGDENKSIVLPDFTLEPGQKIRIHFGQGESNQTDLYLGSEINLNDTAGNLTLRDSILGIEKGYMEYWTPPAQENTAEDWFKRGQELFRNGSKEEAIGAYDKAIELDPENIEAWLGKGTILSLWAGSINDEGLYEDAIKALDKAIELDPQQTRGRLVKANALLNLGKYNESLKIFDEAIEAASQNFEKAQIWFEKGHLFAEQGNYNETTKSLEKVFELAPQDIDLSINGGILLSAVLGRNDDALKYYERAIRIDPDNKLAWVNKANALVRLNRTGEATGAYQEALKITNKSLMADPEDSDLWAEKGLLLHNVGNSDEAVKAFANATRIDPGDETSWKMMGVLLASELHRYDEAALAFDGALQANPEDGQVWSLKADALKALGKSAEAKAAYARAKVLGYKG